MTGLVVGQSELVSVYLLPHPFPPASGKDHVGNALLFVNRKEGTEIVVQRNEDMEAFVFTHVAAVRGYIYGYTPQSGGRVAYTGNYYFYFPGAKDLVSLETDPEMLILHADSTHAWFGKGKEMWRAAISPTGCGKPELVTTLDFEPFRMFDLADIPGMEKN